MSDDNVKQFPAHRIHRIPVNLPEGIDGPVPWDRCLGTPAQVEHNKRVLQKIFGVPAIPCTPEMENDPPSQSQREAAAMITKDHVTYFFTAIAVLTGVWAAFLQGGLVLALTTASGAFGALAGINKMSAAAPAAPPANPTKGT